MTKVNLDTCYSWDRKLYGPGESDIPDELAAAMAPSKSSQSATKSSQQAGYLELINTADSASKITPLPKIGNTAAKIIRDRRPENGYESLEQLRSLCPELDEPKFAVDWKAIERWTE